jgi:hypothetical protein
MNGEIKLLSKMVNSDIIKNIYPAVDHIVVGVYKNPFSFHGNDDVLEFEIYLNNPDIYDEFSMYDNGLDPHYLVDYHIKKLLRYVGLENIEALNFIVYNTDGERISIPGTDWNDK